ncbi:hypothetical protein TRAPUB_1465 [Trametes pubescens]|uniref:Uncharacterized protein n=1 Tax=Trametes pubescens TaxID=154538 RepID=A0A1M2VJC1_TRAPU|nr:hypothetical protein TRAPUB_1465 [Trametes pubescens]
MKLLAVLLSLATLSLGRSARALSGDSLVPAGAGAGAGAGSLLSPGGGGNSLPLRGVADGSGLSLSDLLGPAAAFVPGSHGAPVGPSKASSYVPQAQHLGGSYEKQYRKRETQTTPADVRPTPEPTGASSASTTVHIIDEHDFALLLPDRPDELISDAESDGVAYCTPESTDPACSKRVAEGFIRAAAVTTSDDGAYIQVTGCLDASKSSLDPSDTGGQFDVRFPNGAQCAYGGYGASFIQLKPDDQINCNSHQDRAGCQTAIPGTYDFPSLGVTCED